MIYASIRQKAAQNSVPDAHYNAYQTARQQTAMPIGRGMKVDYLLSNEKYKERLSTYRNSGQSFFRSQSDQDTTSPVSLPYTYREAIGKKKAKDRYMIIGYERRLGCGITFVLHESPTGEVRHRMVIGNSFVASEESEWMDDWATQLGQNSSHTLKYIDTYHAMFPTMTRRQAMKEALRKK